MTQTTTEEIVEKLRIRASVLLADVKFRIDLNFDDPQFKRIMWMAIAEEAKKPAAE